MCVAWLTNYLRHTTEQRTWLPNIYPCTADLHVPLMKMLHWSMTMTLSMAHFQIYVNQHSASEWYIYFWIQCFARWKSEAVLPHCICNNSATLVYTAYHKTTGTCISHWVSFFNMQHRTYMYVHSIFHLVFLPYLYLYTYASGKYFIS